jgi:hypothetical protein
MAPRDPVKRLRDHCLAFPDAHEVAAWGELTFRVRNKIFAIHASPESHHSAGREGVWCKAKPVTQDLLLHAEPKRYFKPPYVGPRGWVGVWLDGGSVDWETLEGLLLDAYRLTAPKRLVAQVDLLDQSEKSKVTGAARKTTTKKVARKVVRRARG